MNEETTPESNTDQSSTVVSGRLHKFVMFFPRSVGLSDRAALYLEELHISGDTMIEMDHSLESLDAGKVGSLYLHDILAGFVESEAGI
ncbi:hypothetical protein KAR91_36980 [Candidatus Pacearchaeota archaeon]|nr:hypothetical protein [Candidatus Pacearchaeota archaeon]